MLYPGGPPWDLSWIGRGLSETANWRGGLPPLLVLVGLNVLLWQRASAATSRDLNFFSVGVTFRVGLLLLLLGGALLSGLRGAAAIGLLWLYLAFGLAAVAISRVSEKASEAQSMRPPAAARAACVQIGLAVLVAVASHRLVLPCLHPSRVSTAFFRLFDPLWQVAQAAAARADRPARPACSTRCCSGSRPG